MQQIRIIGQSNLPPANTPQNKFEGEIKKHPSYFWSDLLISFGLHIVVSIGIMIYIVVGAGNELNFGIILVPILAVFYVIGATIISLIALLIIRLTRLRYGSIYYPLITSLIILLNDILPLTNALSSDVKLYAILLIIPSLVIAIYRMRKYYRAGTENKPNIIPFLISIILALAITIFVQFGARLNIDARHSLREKIDLERLLPQDLYPEYTITYSQDRDSDEYHRIDIERFEKVGFDNPNDFGGIITISLIKVNYDLSSNKTDIKINDKDAIIACPTYYNCNIHWKKGRFLFYFHGSGSTSDNAEKAKQKLIDKMTSIANGIESRSDFLVE